MTRKSERSAGNPRPYSSKKLATPGNLLRSIASPLSVFQLILILSVATMAVSFFTVENTNFSFNPLAFGSGGFIYIIALGVGLKTGSNSCGNNISSIDNVSRTKQYFKAASRLSVYSIITSILTLAILVPSQLVLPPGEMSRSTRFFLVIIIGISYIASYVVVRTLCSFSPKVSSTSFSTYVKVSSIPEIAAIIGFISSPLLLIGAIVYSSSPIVYLKFEFTLIDTIVITIGMTLLYMAFISRL